MISDSIEFESFKNSLFSVADEVAPTIFGTTYSGVLKNNVDYSTAMFAAMFDRLGKLATQGLILPSHKNSAPRANPFRRPSGGFVRSTAVIGSPCPGYTSSEPPAQAPPHLAKHSRRISHCTMRTPTPFSGCQRTPHTQHVGHLRIGWRCCYGSFPPRGIGCSRDRRSNGQRRLNRSTT